MGAEHLQILSLNFQHVSIEDVGRLHVDPADQPDIVAHWKEELELQGMVFLQLHPEGRRRFTFSPTHPPPRWAGSEFTP